MSEAIILKNLHVTFEKGTVNENHVLKGLNLTVNEGDFIAVIGANGSGKSTLLNSIAGAVSIDDGAIDLEGVDISKMKEHKRAHLIGRVFQDPRMGTATRMTIEENMAIATKRGAGRGLAYGISTDKRNFFREKVKLLELGLEERMRTEVGLLSGGQRQALTLLMATLVHPSILLLDEHTAALDPKTAAQVMNLTDKIVSETGLTTLMVTHNMQDALHYGNRLIMLYEGHVVVDLSIEEKSKMQVSDLVRLFKENSGATLDDDNILLA
jgi:putative ABC transport system ATP-binding protein